MISVEPEQATERLKKMGHRSKFVSPASGRLNESRSQNKAHENQGIPLPRSLDAVMPREGMARCQSDVKTLLSLSCPYFAFRLIS